MVSQTGIIDGKRTIQEKMKCFRGDRYEKYAIRSIMGFLIRFQLDSGQSVPAFPGLQCQHCHCSCQHSSQSQLTDCSISLRNQTLLEKSLRCKFTVEKDTWVTGEPAFVTVEIENISYENLNAVILSSFRLERKSNIEPEESSHEEELPYHQRHYRCPIDITKEGSPLDVNDRPRLLLAAGESLTFKVDIARLPWGKSVRSAWPSESLYALVPEGRYDVYLNIEIEDTTSRFSDTDTGIPLPAKRILSDKSAITIIKKNRLPSLH